MWKKIKEHIKANGKNWLLAILTAVAGWLSTDKALEYAAQPEAPPGNLPRVEKPEPVPGNTWTVVAWFTAEKTINMPGLPAFRYSDNIGRYTVFVDAKKEPTAGQIIRALGKELNPEVVTVEVVSVIPPEGWKEPAPGDPDTPEKE